jgi:D-sedoheptulose 7-phosphate isomerase
MDVPIIKKRYFMESNILDNLIIRFPQLSHQKASIERAFIMLKESFSQGGKLLVCGNGGSAADADHIVGELMKSFVLPRKVPKSITSGLKENFGDEGGYIGKKLEGSLPAISLNAHNSLTSAIANDICADMIFGQQVLGYGKKGDVLWGISTSGNSKNICYALMVAKTTGLKTIGLTGRNGGQFIDLCDTVINVGGNITSHIQELHLPIYHTICLMIESYFFETKLIKN